MQDMKQHERATMAAAERPSRFDDRETAGLNRRDRRALAAIDKATAKIDRKIEAIENRGRGDGR